MWKRVHSVCIKYEAFSHSAYVWLKFCAFSLKRSNIFIVVFIPQHEMWF